MELLKRTCSERNIQFVRIAAQAIKSIVYFAGLGLVLIFENASEEQARRLARFIHKGGGVA